MKTLILAAIVISASASAEYPNNLDYQIMQQQQLNEMRRQTQELQRMRIIQQQQEWETMQQNHREFERNSPPGTVPPILPPIRW